jgi:L-ascorbate 6-phosphate lactonase
MDTDALPILAKKNPRTHFVGPIECMKMFREWNIPEKRCSLLEEGAVLMFDGVKITGVFADHGELAPDALGVVLEVDGTRIYHTGDTAFRPNQFRPAIDMQPDLLIPCINGAFGNMNEREAALLTKLVTPSLVIPCHFGMFAEQNGDPELFRRYCAELAPHIDTLLMRPEEEFVFEKKSRSNSA